VGIDMARQYRLESRFFALIHDIPQIVAER
jgi:hypothetical protein